MNLSVQTIMQDYFCINWLHVMLLHTYFDNEDLNIIFDCKKDTIESPNIWIKRDSELGMFLTDALQEKLFHNFCLASDSISLDGTIRLVCKSVMKVMVDREKWYQLSTLMEWCALPKEILCQINFNDSDVLIKHEMEKTIQMNSFVYDSQRLLPFPVFPSFNKFRALTR